jgi:hypothetical protein
VNRTDEAELPEFDPESYGDPAVETRLGPDDDELDEELTKAYKKAGVPRALRDTVIEYVQDSADITNALRNPGAAAPHDLTRALALQDWLTYGAPPIDEDTLVWRGEKLVRNAARRYFSAISGWSLSAEKALRFAGDTCCLYRMLLPKGTRAMFTLTNEYELLIGKHQFRFLGARKFTVPDDMMHARPAVADDTITVRDLQLVI